MSNTTNLNLPLIEASQAQKHVTHNEALQILDDAQLITSGVTGDRPASPVVGFNYFDTTITKPIWYDGTGWVDATGTTV